MKELWLLTRQYPEGRGEAFITTALTVWARQFDRVLVVPMFNGPGLTDLPEGVELRRLWGDPFRSLPAAATVVRAPHVLRNVARRRGGHSLGHALSNVRQMLYKRDRFMAQLMPHYDPQRVCVLSAWMEDWATVLGLVKEQDPRLRYAVMAHGSDLYTERHANGRIPYRAWQVRQADRVICIARHGADYLRARFPEHAGKVEVAHLGTMDHGAGPWAPAEALRIVSCAYLRPPKRIHLLARALAHVRRPVHWTHFGDGADRAALDEAVAALPPHITVDMPGNVVPEEVIAWYRRTPADLFVHLSGHEGVPVAMMEAISFGIPVWANDVGGVAELLRPPAGKLLPPDIDPARLAALLDGPEADHWRQAEVRRDVRAYWQEQFAAEANCVHIVSQASCKVPQPSRL